MKEVEQLSAKFHDIYQQEAKRQAELGIDEVRHTDKYDDLPERTKEYDRVLARYVLKLLGQAISTERERVLKIIEVTTEDVMVKGNGQPYEYAVEVLKFVKAEVERLK